MYTPLDKISMCLGHQGARGTTKIWLQGNLFHQPDIRLKNTTKLFKNVGKIIIEF
jgi:hypothetical protein